MLQLTSLSPDYCLPLFSEPLDSSKRFEVRLCVRFLCVARSCTFDYLGSTHFCCYLVSLLLLVSLHFIVLNCMLIVFSLIFRITFVMCVSIFLILYQEYDVNFSWQRQKIAMTPLFAASQIQSQMSSQESSYSIGMIRATQQSLQFSPTQQEPGTLNWMNPTFQVLHFIWLPLF